MVGSGSAWTDRHGFGGPERTIVRRRAHDDRHDLTELPWAIRLERFMRGLVLAHVPVGGSVPA